MVMHKPNKFSEALAKSVKLGKDMASESYIPPMAPEPYATERQKRIDTIMLKEYVKDLTDFRRHKQQLIGVLLVISSPNFRESLEADDRFYEAKAKSDLFVLIKIIKDKVYNKDCTKFEPVAILNALNQYALQKSQE